MKITELKKEISVKEFIADYVDVPRFSAGCEKCPEYGKTWACPPYDFDRPELISRFDTVLLVAKKTELDDERIFPSDEELKNAWEELLLPVNTALNDELLALEADSPGSLALFAGGCGECEVCSREADLPCVHPEKCRYSPEALCADVVKILEDLFSENVEWAEKGRLPKKYVLLGGLLKKAES